MFWYCQLNSVTETSVKLLVSLNFAFRMLDKFGISFKTGSKVVLLLVILTFSSCEKESFSDSVIPTLSLTSANILPHPVEPRDSIIILDLSYTDGDGDIGFKDDDTLSSSNLVVRFFEIINGIETPFVIPLSTDTLNFNQRTPFLTPIGEQKSIKGEIKLKIPINPFPGYRPDSLIFKCQLFDRQLNASQIVVTPILVVTH